MSATHHHDDRLRLEDYEPYSHLLPKTDLTFDLHSGQRTNDKTGKDEEYFDVTVRSKLHFTPNPEAEQNGTLVLNGAPESLPEGDSKPTLELCSIVVDGKTLSEEDYTRDGETLTLHHVPGGDFDVEVETRIIPSDNKAYKGLYHAGDKLVTHCESTGFRNMSFFPDRPDVLSEYTTTIIGDEERFSTMVAGGTQTTRETTDDGRTAVTYHDPAPKPSYLFAMSAGKFDILRDTYTIGEWRDDGQGNPIPNSRAGETIELEVYVEPGDAKKAQFALDSLKTIMAWDEEMFDREYDGDTYRMLATDYFNAGAMENKGLNIFNSKRFLADPETATDKTYEGIFSVVAHEYSHNWSGNRVTIQDWFELALKEGFTSLREQIFTDRFTDEDVQRIGTVSGLRSRQFAEDASAEAHPVRPDSIGTVRDMYTGTIYGKGSEVFRMLRGMVGEEAFKDGTNLYFAENDGKAVRADALIDAVQEASGVDLEQFKDTWYNQAGTPQVKVSDSFDAATHTYTMEITQEKPMVNAENFPKNDPYHIPIKMGLLDENGEDIPLQLVGDDASLTNDNTVLNLRDRKQTFTFQLPDSVTEKPCPSLLRGFSAPVELDYDYSSDDLLFLLNNDTDNFNRWDAGQKLGEAALMEQISAAKNGRDVPVNAELIEAFRAVATDEDIRPAIKAELLTLPSSAYIKGKFGDGEVDVTAIGKGYAKVRQSIAEALEPALAELYDTHAETMERPYDYNGEDAGSRSLRHRALKYLLRLDDNAQYVDRAAAEFDAQDNKTDVLSGLSALVKHGTAEQGDAALNQYYEKWQDNPAMLDTWFSMQAGKNAPDTLEKVKALTQHEAYDANNPNMVRTLVGAFSSNTPQFHRKDGEGYKFVADQVAKANVTNERLAASLVGPLLDAKKYDPVRQEKMVEQLEDLAERPEISKRVRIKVETALKDVAASRAAKTEQPTGKSAIDRSRFEPATDDAVSRYKQQGTAESRGR